MNNYIPYGKQSICQADIDAVNQVLLSDWLTQGPMIAAFEKAVAEYTGADFAVAVSNATAALHLSCLALDLAPGDYLWTSPNTFVASANCAIYCGASVDFVDIDLTTYNINTLSLEKKLQNAALNNQLPKIVVVVHFAGQSCEMKRVYELSKLYGFKIIEDASHAIGGTHHQQKIGSCEYSDVCIFSFHPVKIITTGEGGIIVTKQKEVYERLMRLRTHGITRDENIMENEPDGPWYYEQLELGFNYRITDFQAALGLSQLKRLDSCIEKRREIVARYNEGLSGLPVQLPHELKVNQSAWHLYAILLDLEKTQKSRLEIFKTLRNANIGVNVHYIPVYRQPYYQKLGFKKQDYPNTEYYYERTITLPLFPDLSHIDQKRVISVLQDVL